MKNMGVERTDTITLSTTGQIGTQKSVLFIITQEAKPVLQITSNDTAIIHDATDVIPIKFYVGGSAKGWKSEITDMDINSNFITLSTSNTDTGAITITAKPRKNMGVERTDTITLSTTGQIGEPVSDIFTITQEAAPRIILTSPTDGGNIPIAHDDTLPKTITFFVGGSATGWESEISYMPETDTLITLDTNMNDNQTDTVIIMATPSANDTTVKRKAIIKLITTGPGETPNSDSLTITQEARPTIMLTSHSDGETITIAHDDNTPRSISFSLGGGANGWKIEITDNDFIESFQSEGTKGDTIAIPILSENEDTIPRTATITLSTAEHLGTPASVSLTIIQEGKPALDPISNHNDIIAYDSTDSIPIKFFVGGSATGWESKISYMPETDTFITLSLEKDTAQTDTITIKASPIENMGEIRTATITLSTTGQKGDSVSRSLTITQEAVPTIKVNSIDQITSSIDSISIAHDDTLPRTINFTVGGSAKGWTDSIIYTPDNVDFIMLQRQENKDDGTRVIKIIPSVNTTTEERTATVTLSTTGQKGTPKSVSLTITQEAIPVLQITSKGTTIIHDETDSIPITFNVGGSATGWTSMNSNINFVKLGTTMNDNQTNTIIIKASPMKNMGDERTDTIILSTTGQIGDPVSGIFTITEKAAPRITLTSPSDTSISIPHNEIMPRTISFTLKGSASGITYMPPEDTSFITLDTLNDGTRAITITPTTVNTTTEERTETITLRTTGSEGTPDSVLTDHHSRSYAYDYVDISLRW